MSKPVDRQAEASARVRDALRGRRPLWRFLVSLCGAAMERGATVHLVGGTVRDLVAGAPAGDIDLMVTGVGFDELGSLLQSLPRDRLGIRRIVAAGRRFAVYKVATRWSGEDLDVALARAPSRSVPAGDGAARADVSRRDFTINSLLFTFRIRGRRLDGSVVDHFGGIADLDRRLIRAVGDPRKRFREDPVRLLRAVRLANERPGFTVERRTGEAIRAAAPRAFRGIPGDRLAGELLRALAAGPEGTVDDLRRLGLLEALLPELRGAAREAAGRMKRRYVILRGALGSPLPDAVLFAGLLADAARSESPSRSRARRPGPAASPPSSREAMKAFRNPRAEAIGRRLRIPRVRRVVQLIEDLRRLEGLRTMPNPNATAEKIFGRWDEPRHLLAFYEAAQRAASRRGEDFRPLLRRISRRPTRLSGSDVIALGVAPGPRVEWVLDGVREAVLSGKVLGRTSALRMARALAEAPSSPPSATRKAEKGRRPRGGRG